MHKSSSNSCWFNSTKFEKILYTKKRILHKKRLTKLIPKLLSKFSRSFINKSEMWIFQIFIILKWHLHKVTSLPLKNLTKHLNRCISGNVFLAFDSRRLPENIKETAGYRNGKLEILIIHCSKMKEGTFKGNTKLVLSGKVLNTLCIWQVTHTIARLTMKCNHIRKMRKIRKKVWRDKKILGCPIYLKKWKPITLCLL